MLEEKKIKSEQEMNTINNPKFYEAYAEETLSKFPERMEGFGGSDLTSNEISLRKHILYNYSTIAQNQIQKKFKEKFELGSKAIVNKPTDQDEFIDVGAGYMVRVLRRAYEDVKYYNI
jgi:hypothetical protein